MAFRPTPADLLVRLRAIHEATTNDDLHKKLPRSVRTLERWKKSGWPQNVEAALEMLSETGLLRLTEAGSDGGASSELVLARLVASVGTLVESHSEALADLQDVRTRLAAAEEQIAADRAALTRRQARKRTGG